MNELPKMIWLQTNEEEIQNNPSVDEITWAPEEITGEDTCYIREDIFQDFHLKVRSDLLRILIRHGFSYGQADDLGEENPKMFFYKFTPGADTVLTLPLDHCIDPEEEHYQKPSEEFCFMKIHTQTEKFPSKRKERVLYFGEVNPFSNSMMNLILNLVVKG